MAALTLAGNGQGTAVASVSDEAGSYVRPGLQYGLRGQKTQREGYCEETTDGNQN